MIVTVIKIRITMQLFFLLIRNFILLLCVSCKKYVSVFGLFSDFSLQKYEYRKHILRRLFLVECLDHSFEMSHLSRLLGLSK